MFVLSNTSISWLSQRVPIDSDRDLYCCRYTGLVVANQPSRVDFVVLGVTTWQTEHSHSWLSCGINSGSKRKLGKGAVRTRVQGMDRLAVVGIERDDLAPDR
jgi:hypothetical protein